RRGGAAGERQHLHALGPGDLQRHRVGDRAAGVLQFRGAGAGDDVDVDGDRLRSAEVGLRDVQRLDVGGVHAAGDVVQAPVQQVQAGERRGVADAGDALDGGVHLELVGVDLFGRERAAVGGLDDEV